MRISDWSSYVCSSDLMGFRILRGFVRADFLMHEPRYDIPVAAADLHLRARSEHEEAFAVGVRFDLLDLAEVDDRRAMDALEIARVEPFFQILHRLAQDQAVVGGLDAHIVARGRSEEHTSELQSLMRTSYAVFCLKKKKK